MSWWCLVASVLTTYEMQERDCMCMAVWNIPLLCDARDQNFSAARRRGGLDYMQPMEVELDKAKLLQGMSVNHTDNFSRCLNLSITYGIWKTRPHLYIFTKERQAIPKNQTTSNKSTEARLRQSICKQADIATRLS